MTTSGIIDLGDGRELVFTLRAKAEERRPTLKDIWKAEAPFSYEYMTGELLRHEIISAEGIWIHYPIRGNHSTCAIHVRALYESLLMFNCIDELSFPEVRQIFTNSFNTVINNSKVIENKNKCRQELDFFHAIFKAFANADTNADANTTDE